MDGRIFLCMLLAAFLLSVPAFSEESAAPAPVSAAEPAETLPAIENLDFASGEVVAYGNGNLDVKVYLDAAGEASEETLSLTIDDKTEITNGETELKPDALKQGAEVDVEYDVQTKQATYIFVY